MLYSAEQRTTETYHGVGDTQYVKAQYMLRGVTTNLRANARVRRLPVYSLVVVARPPSQVAKNPPVSAAFDDFAQKALCQESVLFLKAVAS